MTEIANLGLWGAIFAAALVHLAGAMSPGPNFVIVGRNSVASGFPAGAATVGGVATGSIGYALLALAGINSVMEALPALYRGIQIAGGLYLAWLGIQMWRKSGAPNPPAPLSSSPKLTFRQSFVQGLAVQATNAKTAIFFISVFAASLPRETPFWAQVVLISMVFLSSLLWYATVARFFAIRRIREGYLKGRRWIDRITGSVMLAFGARLLFAAR